MESELIFFRVDGKFQDYVGKDEYVEYMITQSPNTSFARTLALLYPYYYHFADIIVEAPMKCFANILGKVNFEMGLVRHHINGKMTGEDFLDRIVKYNCLSVLRAPARINILDFITGKDEYIEKYLPKMDFKMNEIMKGVEALFHYKHYKTIRKICDSLKCERKYFVREFLNAYVSRKYFVREFLNAYVSRKPVVKTVMMVKKFCKVMDVKI